jgi:hypothetical protein
MSHVGLASRAIDMHKLLCGLLLSILVEKRVAKGGNVEVIFLFLFDYSIGDFVSIASAYAGENDILRETRQEWLFNVQSILNEDNHCMAWRHCGGDSLAYRGCDVWDVLGGADNVVEEGTAVLVTDERNRF